ncbi:MAG: ribonuclease HI family protein [Candidatus Babeliaceae bacterium]|jgi:ribonuclease HI
MTIKKQSHRWHLYVDGASRHNPGLSGAGVYLLKNDVPVVKQGFFLGIKTNNQAEYFALLLGVFFAQRHMGPDDILLINADSELMVKQLIGEYKIKNESLFKLYTCVKARLEGINYAVRHVMRKDNGVADKLANLGIDKKLPVPQEFYTLCSAESYE